MIISWGFLRNSTLNDRSIQAPCFTIDTINCCEFTMIGLLEVRNPNMNTFITLKVNNLAVTWLLPCIQLPLINYQ